MHTTSIASFLSALLMLASLPLSAFPSLGQPSGSGDSDRSVGIVAHRGFWKSPSALGAQNSIAALSEAQKEGFWGSEFDVQMTLDGVPVVHHDDFRIGSGGDTLYFRSREWKDFSGERLPNGESIPTLEEYLSQGEKSSSTMLVLEVKGQGSEERDITLSKKCIEALKRHGLFSPERVCFISFSYPAVKFLCDAAPSFKVQYLTGDKDPSVLHSEGIDGIDYNHKVFSRNPSWIGSAHSLGMDVNVWTVDGEDDMKRMVDEGADFITTNEPLRLRDILSKAERKAGGTVPVRGDGYFAYEHYNPVANEGATIIEGNARFTVLTSRLIRMEWSADGAFEDRPSLGVVNRNLPVPRYSVERKNGKLIIKTDSLTLSYSPSLSEGGEFTDESLSVRFLMGGSYSEWKPSLSPDGNLLGTTRTLDGCDGEKVSDPFDLGVASRDGWAVIDESTRHLLVPSGNSWGEWVQSRDSSPRKDLYLFAYGHAYRDAVSDFTKISGRIPLPPKWAFGYWWCRFWQYSDYELRDLAEHFRDFSIPIDVMIIDMDWHETWNPDEFPGLRDESGQGIGWTGYTWKKQLFPNPETCLSELHSFKLKTALNLHPAAGIQIYEEPYRRFVADYLSRTADYDGPKGFVKADGTPTYVPFRIDQMAWADSYFSTILHPMEKMGVDFWWIDWQQWKESRYTPGLSNTFWLNHVFFRDFQRQVASSDPSAALRPMIYHRWGGIGSHRYQVGFSGDTYATWKALAFLPYFTATASNVGYGYWGHDIGGHMQPSGVRHTDPELYTRWLQEGVFTPIFKTHSTKDMSMEKRFWVFPEHFDAMKEAIRLRYSLSPYIYTYAREAFDSGVSICRPLYYSYPEDERSYSMKEQFFFGDDILATAVCQSADTLTGLSERRMWFPSENGLQGWYDMSTGMMYAPGSEKTLLYTIDENPWFVRAGSVIPMASPRIANLQDASDELWLSVAPGAGDFSTRVYEDDGVSQAYGSDFAFTRIDKRSDPSSLQMKISSREGSFKGAPSQRAVRIVLHGVLPPSKVAYDGREVPYQRFASNGDDDLFYLYDGESQSITVYLPRTDVSATQKVSLEWEGEASPSYIYGKKGLIRRMMKLAPDMKYAVATYVKWDKNVPIPFLDICQAGSYMTEDPSGAKGYLQGMDIPRMLSDIGSYHQIPSSYHRRVEAQTHFER